MSESRDKPQVKRWAIVGLSVLVIAILGIGLWYWIAKRKPTAPIQYPVVSVYERWQPPPPQVEVVKVKIMRKSCQFGACDLPDNEAVAVRYYVEYKGKRIDEGLLNVFGDLYSIVYVHKPEGFKQGEVVKFTVAKSDWYWGKTIDITFVHGEMLIQLEPYV